MELLKFHDVWFETFEHEEVRTSHEAAQVRTGHYTLEQGAKALILRVKKSSNDSQFVMLVLSGALRFDSKKVKKMLSARDIRFATEEEVFEITDGIQPGGVPPFGNLFSLPVIADPALLAQEKIIFNAGDKRFSIGMKSIDYIHIVKPLIESISV